MRAARWQVTAQGRRFRDPFRVIVSVLHGAGTDVLEMDCGHTIVKNHVRLWGRTTGCHGCREWEDAL